MKKIIYGVLLIVFPVLIFSSFSFLGGILPALFLTMGPTAVLMSRIGIYVTFVIATVIAAVLTAEVKNLPAVPLWIGTLISLAITVYASFPNLFISVINSVCRLIKSLGFEYQYDLILVLYTSLFLLSFYVVITLLHYRRKNIQH